MLAAKLTLTYGTYHLAMLHRQLAMSEELTICTTPSMPMRYCGINRVGLTTIRSAWSFWKQGGGGIQENNVVNDPFGLLVSIRSSTGVSTYIL